MAPLAAGAALALSEEIHGEGHQKGAVVGVSLGLWDSDFHFGSLMGWDAVVVNGGFCWVMAGRADPHQNW